MKKLKAGDRLAYEIKVVPIRGGVARCVDAIGREFITSTDMLKTGKPVSKYAPCRLFRKGDRVRVVKCKGRDYNAWARSVENEIYVIDVDECLDCELWLVREGQSPYSIDPAYLELVTPVEEQYRAVYNEQKDCWDVMFEDTLCARYYVGKYPCAENYAFRDAKRLNAELRGRVGTKVPCSEDGKEQV